MICFQGGRTTNRNKIRSKPHAFVVVGFLRQGSILRAAEFSLHKPAEHQALRRQLVRGPIFKRTPVVFVMIC